MLSHSIVSDSLQSPRLARQSPWSMEFPRQKHWNGLPFLHQGILPTQVEPTSPALASGLFTTSATWKGYLISLPCDCSSFHQRMGLYFSHSWHWVWPCGCFYLQNEVGGTVLSQPEPSEALPVCPLASLHRSEKQMYSMGSSYSLRPAPRETDHTWNRPEPKLQWEDMSR